MAEGVKVSYEPIQKLKPAEYNPRVISGDEFEGLKESIKTFGLVDPIIVNKDMTIIGGHQRVKAAEALGLKEVPCVVLDLDKHMEKKLNVILNSPAISGKYDDSLLSEILEELKLDDDYTSLRLNELEPLDLSPTEVEEDEAPEVSQEPPVSKLGEIYQLGRHKVMCGDSTDKASVELLMDGVKADLAITDPPYGINIVQGGSVGGEKLAKTTEYSPIANDDGVETAHKAIEIMKNTTENQIVFGGNYFADRLEPKMCWVVWDKDNTGNFADCELAWTSFDKAAKLYKVTWNGMIREGESDKRVHPTQKPIKLFGYIIRDFEVSTVQDLFLGSGSTLIACEQTDRTCYGMELDPKYVDVIRKRYAKFVGKEDNWQEVTKAI